MNFKKIITLVILGIFLTTIVSALYTLKPAKINEDYVIFQTCSSCTYVNMTVSNQNAILIYNVEMANNGSGNWIYNFTPTTLGRHDVTGEGDINGIDTSFATTFMVTPNGEELTVSQSILYTVFIFFLFLAISFLTYFIIILPSENERGEGDAIIYIVKLKYLRVLFLGLLYPLIVIMLNLLNGLAVNFVTLSIFSGTLGFLFETMLRGVWVFTVVLFVWMIYLLIQDSNISKQIKKLERL